ncbi:hypothetical protein N7478_010448 [Penicillium angulare]|uniref:uncharacterized protein n=1 Tax=Penicillium angulare TaxID=116970 RepID=UPI00253FD48D|nr:uncharacterized protein N7478_010448 [Penicillium angulare]KAJ5267640.1 hypothetical protein N7478_010448 [Penicillium angulare]
MAGTERSIKLLNYQPNPRAGKHLTQEENDFIIHLCISNKYQGPFSEHKKGFWMQMSDRFEASCGRPYSWQSCRRRLLAWENKQIMESQDEATGGIFRQAIPLENEYEEGNEIYYEAEDNDDSLLPEPITPLIRRGHAMCEIEQAALQKNVADMVSSTLDSFEDQLKTITKVLNETREGQSAIHDAFDTLKAELQMSVERFTNRSASR